MCLVSDDDVGRASRRNGQHLVGDAVVAVTRSGAIAVERDRCSHRTGADSGAKTVRPQCEDENVEVDGGKEAAVGSRGRRRC